jgi:hypothetical protein
MLSVTALDAMLQVISSLLFYVAVFLMLALCTIIGLVIAELISERDCVVQAYGPEPVRKGCTARVSRHIESINLSHTRHRVSAFAATCKDVVAVVLRRS